MAMPPPNAKKDKLNRTLFGAYGQFGAGAGVRAFYLQSTLTPQQLHWVSLISDIRGSEQWAVRDLFQRDVDHERIRNSLLPYLRDSDRIKFFNPLTVTVLPIGEDGFTIDRQMSRAKDSTIHLDDYEWTTIERPGYYRVRWIPENEHYAALDWNDATSRLVAIDGQHRLSALKRLTADERQSQSGGFTDWRIPVVVVSFRADLNREPPRVLEVVRGIFVDINKEAHQVSRAREILLSDRDISAVCTQELVQGSHENDLKPILKRDPKCLPLLFYDWRAEEVDKERERTPAAIRGVDEVYDWFSHYLLPMHKHEDAFSDDRRSRLAIDNATPALKSCFDSKQLDHKGAGELRQHIRNDFLPGVSLLLEGFGPLKNYVHGLRKIEKSYRSEESDDLSRHAFHQLRFGANHAEDSNANDVDRKVHEITAKIVRLKEGLVEVVKLDIGLRGIMAAFGRLFGEVHTLPTWRSYAAWFVGGLNRMYDDGLLDLDHRLLMHIAKDHEEKVVNYRLDKVDDALGCYIEVFVGAYGFDWLEDRIEDDWETFRDARMDVLKDVLLRGYKREVRPELKREFPNGGRPLTDAVSREAEKRRNAHAIKLHRRIESAGGARSVGGSAAYARDTTTGSD